MSPQRDQAHRKGDPNLAALLGWLLPGAGHLYLGRLTTGILAFMVIEGLFLLGLELSGGMTFEYLDHELRTAFAPALSPEAGNLGGFLYQMKTYGFGPPNRRPWPEHMQLGVLLTSLSGVLNLFVMVHAHLAARSTKDGFSKELRAPAIATALTWVVPGLGHLYQGRRARAVMVFVTLVGLFVVGTLLAEGSNLSRERHFYYWAGQFMLGAPAILAELAFGDMRITEAIRFAEPGLVFGCIAGMLNVLAMIDVFAYGEARSFGLPLKTLQAEPSADIDEAGEQPA